MLPLSASGGPTQVNHVAHILRPGQFAFLILADSPEKAEALLVSLIQALNYMQQLFGQQGTHLRLF